MDSILGNASTVFLVLYSDGQLMVSDMNSPILTKKLSQQEIDQLFAQLESKGLYSLETNQKHDPTDHLYNFGAPYQESYDGLYYYVSTNEKQSRLICVYQPIRDFLLPQMKDVLEFLGNYAPDHLSKYQPDRILLSVVKGTKGFTSEPATSVPWPTYLPSLETISQQQIAYFDGEVAQSIFSLFAYSWDAKVFEENDQDYSVLVYVVLPHEDLSIPQQWSCSQ